MQSRLLPFAKDIARRYQDGEIASALAQEYGVSTTNMRYFLKTICGIPLRPPNRGKKPQQPAGRERAIVRDYTSGHSMMHLAAKYGLAYSTVQSIIDRYGAATGRRLRSPSLRVPTNTAELGYLAALVDGEGCIRIFEDAIRHRVVVRIANTDRALMDWLAQFGGTIHWHKRPDKPHYKPGGSWTVAQAIDAYHLLVAIEPYMIIKRARAQEAIASLRARWHFT
jgi:hypothetical protein